MLKGMKMKQYNVKGLQTRQVIMLPSPPPPPPPPPIGFMLCQNGLQYECETFRLLVYAYGVIENATFVQLRLNSLP